MAKPIDDAVERCHHFVDEMAAIEHAFGVSAVKIRSQEAQAVRPHLVPVLLELERLRAEKELEGDATYQCGLCHHAIGDLTECPNCGCINNCDTVHNWFELTYSSYLVLPRVLLCEMPRSWQERFVKCLRELDEAWKPAPEEGNYQVTVRNEKGKYVSDPLSNYRRPSPGLIEEWRRDGSVSDADKDPSVS